MHPSTFEYLKPIDAQLAMMERLRKAAADYGRVLDENVPDGEDKVYLLRKLREVAMWVNVAITRTADGSPRID